jgi:hypothetical protein
MATPTPMQMACTEQHSNADRQMVSTRGVITKRAGEMREGGGVGGGGRHGRVVAIASGPVQPAYVLDCGTCTVCSQPCMTLSWCAPQLGECESQFESPTMGDHLAPQGPPCPAKPSHLLLAVQED